MIYEMPYTVLFDILGKEDALKVCRQLKGCRIYFPKVPILAMEVQEDYRKMVKMNVPKNEITKRLSDLYELPRYRILELLKKVV